VRGRQQQIDADHDGAGDQPDRIKPIGPPGKRPRRRCSSTTSSTS
jgi:hypothetical protein